MVAPKSSGQTHFPIALVVNIIVTLELRLAWTADMASFNPVVQRRLDAVANELVAEFDAEVFVALTAAPIGNHDLGRGPLA